MWKFHYRTLFSYQNIAKFITSHLQSSNNKYVGYIGEGLCKRKTARALRDLRYKYSHYHSRVKKDPSHMRAKDGINEINAAIVVRANRLIAVLLCIAENYERGSPLSPTNPRESFVRVYVLDGDQPFSPAVTPHRRPSTSLKSLAGRMTSRRRWPLPW